ncbi:hypothetical protein DV735_g4551, partial [Chaetothyriales sp. CBS 134920]
MGAHYDFSANAPIPEMVEHSYPIYDNHYNPYSRLAGPPSHYDAVAFWYRPDHPESLYEPSAGIYNPAMAISPPQMDTAGVKHRRTRSGCYTCRSRRVKCDETRPICERCKKGGRECEFPQTTSSTSSKRSKHAEAQQSGRGKGREGKAPTLDSIKDEPEEMDEQLAKPGRRPTMARSRTQSTQSLSRKQRQRPTDELSPLLKEKASPQSTTGSSPHSFPATPTSLPPYNNSTAAESQAREAKIKALKPEMQKYLEFQRDQMTYYHYFFKIDPTDFIHTEFIDQALSYEPLLNAVVGFAAYHYALRQPEASLVHFLHFHSKALVMLRKSLEKQTQYTEAMLLTVLQLATVEEYLGDWVNLVGHHRASYTILMAVYPKPEAMMMTELGRRIFSWYARFDVMTGLMAGGTPRLDRRWFEANAAWYAGAVDDDPDDDVDIDGTLSSYVASSRLVAFDMARLFARMQLQMASGSAASANAGDEHQQPSLSSPPSSSATSPSFSPSVSTPSSSTPSHITLEQFHAEYGAIRARLDEMKSQLEALNDGFFTVKSFPTALTQPYDPATDIVNPYIPGGLFKGVLWNLNLMWIDWYAIDQMLKHQTSLLLQQPLPMEELGAISLQQCRIYEAIERYPDAPKGAILGAQASLALATLFLPKDDKHTMWARRKLADIERIGYIFPERYRKQMAIMWGLSRDRVDEANSVEDWWLPNHEGMLPILQEIRRVVSERHARGSGSTSDGGIGTGIAIGQGEGDDGDKMLSTGGVQDVRDLKAIFAQLELHSQRAAAAAAALGPRLQQETKRNADANDMGASNDVGYETGHHYGNNDNWARNMTKDPSRMSGLWS